MRYADGEIVQAPMRVGKEIRDWEGKGFHFHEWENPRPSTPLSSLVLKGGDGESCANVVAISALPTLFAKPYAHRIDIPRETIHAAKRKVVEIPLPKPMGVEEIRNGVLRFLASHPPRSDGSKPQFSSVGAQIAGVSADGTRGWSSPSATMSALSAIRNGYRASVVAADEWAEIEIPLSELLSAVSEKGMGLKITSVTGIRLNALADSSNLYREVRIEY